MTDIQTNRQTDRQTNKQTDRQTIFFVDKRKKTNHIPLCEWQPGVVTDPKVRLEILSHTTTSIEI